MQNESDRLNMATFNDQTGRDWPITITRELVDFNWQACGFDAKTLADGSTLTDWQENPERPVAALWHACQTLAEARGINQQQFLADVGENLSQGIGTLIAAYAASCPSPTVRPVLEALAASFTTGEDAGLAEVMTAYREQNAQQVLALAQHVLTTGIFANG